MLKLFNTATRRLEKFKPLNDPVRVYTCGPTVYNFPHIGNFAAYTYWDLLVRVLRANGYRVRRVLNLTDVGHLVSDGDEGEDKLERSATREGKTPEEIAEFYANVYLKNYAELEFLPPDVIARATDFIAEDMVEVNKMTERGFTYETRDGIYFDTAKFPDYAKFARLDPAGLQAGKRVEFSAEKRHATDFAVWKFIQPGERHAMRWNYLGRPGYPGWHLECSTIIHATLGEPIDIHTGGVDHIPVHHTNEIAQTYAAEGLELAKYWLHCDFITIDGQKISKSLGNTYTLEDLAARGFSAMDYKMWLLSGHYQGTRNFTFESLAAAQKRRLNWRARIAHCYQVAAQSEVASAQSSSNLAQMDAEPQAKFAATQLTNARSKADNAATSHDASAEPRTKFAATQLKSGSNGGNFGIILDAVNNNLNSAEAFKEIDAMDLTLDEWQQVDNLFGLRLIQDTPDVPADVYALIRQRDQARADKDFATADRIRDELWARGIQVNDTPDGGMWEYAEESVR